MQNTSVATTWMGSSLWSFSYLLQVDCDFVWFYLCLFHEGCLLQLYRKARDELGYHQLIGLPCFTASLVFVSELLLTKALSPGLGPSTALGLLVAHQALENIFQFWYKCPWAVFLLPPLVGKGKLVSRRLCWIFPAIVWNTGACHWTTPGDSTPLYGISVKMALVTAKGPGVPQVILTRCFFIFSLMSYCVCNPHYEHEKLHNHLCKWKVALWNSLLHLHL